METNAGRSRNERWSAAHIVRAFVLSLCALGFVGGAAANVCAQSPSPSPSPTSTHSLSDNLTRMTLEASRLLPYYIYEVESPLMDWFIKLAQLLAVAITMTAFLRVLRQHEGGSFDLGWWFARVAICVALITMTTSVINFASSMGNAVAVGTGDTDSWLNSVRRAQQESFNDSYSKFQAGTFTVRVNGADLPVNPNPDPNDPGYGIIGVLYNREAKLTDVESRLDVSSWSMTTLFSLLSFCRGILEFGDFFLMLIRSFLLIGVRLFAPFMVAVAIDREFAKQSAYKFAWGVAILTLVFPSVAQIVRIMAYGAGNMALMLGDQDPLYKWDAATMTAVTDPTANPVFVIIVMAIVMGICGIAMMFVPLISYKIVMGELYQGVSNVVSGITGAGIATGVGTVSATTGAAINRQAELSQVQGQSDAATVSADARRESGLLSAKGSEVASVASARGAMIAQLAGIEGARQAGVIQAAAAGTFGRESTAASVAQQGRETVIRSEQSQTMIGAQQRRERSNTLGEERAARRDAWINHGFGSVPYVGPAIGEGVISGWKGNYGPITTRSRAQQDSSAAYAQTASGAETTARNTLVTNQQQYGHDVSDAYTRQEGADIGAVNRQAGIAAGGAERGTSVTIGGIQSKYNYDVQAINTEHTGQVGDQTHKGAIQIMREAGENSARMHEWAADVQAVGSIIANQSSSLFRELRF